MADFEVVEGELESDALVIIKNVPVIQAGVRYKCSNGEFTPTPEDLADFVESQTDPAIHAPRNFIGHTDEEGRLRCLSGEPSLGVYQNLHLSENGTLVYGDIYGVPKWLAEIMPTAYANRSGEWWTNYKTHSGKTWRLACDPGIALLGIKWPGIHGLDDLPVVFSAEGPEGVELIEMEDEAVATSAAPIEAQVNVIDVERVYYDEFATQDSGRYWWLIRAQYIDPHELIVEDIDTGQLYRVPFSVSGESITFGEPEAVKIEYVPDPNASTEASAQDLVLAAMSEIGKGRTPAAVYASRERSRPNQKKEAKMSGILDSLRSKLRLASDATEEDILDAVPEPQDNPEGEPEVTPDGENVDDPEGGETPAEGESGEAAPAETAKGDHVLVDRATWDQVQAGARDGAALKAADDARRRESAVDGAIKAGKIPPARREHYMTLMEADEEGTTKTLEALEAGALPVGEAIGSAKKIEAGGDLNVLFPQLSKGEDD